MYKTSGNNDIFKHELCKQRISGKLNIKILSDPLYFSSPWEPLLQCVVYRLFSCNCNELSLVRLPEHFATVILERTAFALVTEEDFTLVYFVTSLRILIF